DCHLSRHTTPLTPLGRGAGGEGLCVCVQNLQAQCNPSSPPDPSPRSTGERGVVDAGAGFRGILAKSRASLRDDDIMAMLDERVLIPCWKMSNRPTALSSAFLGDPVFGTSLFHWPPRSSSRKCWSEGVCSAASAGALVGRVLRVVLPVTLE